MPFFREWAQRFGKQREFFHLNGQLVRFCAEQETGYPDEIADIELLEKGMQAIANGIFLHVELDPARAILDMTESRLAKAPKPDKPAGQRDRDLVRFQLFLGSSAILFFEQQRLRVCFELSGVRWYAHLVDLSQFLEPLLDQIVVVFH